MTADTIDLDNLDISDDGTGDAIVDGVPFTGIAIERDEQTGSLLACIPYEGGKRIGPSRTWFRSGQQESEEYFLGGGYHGPRREWYESGRLALYAYYECDLLVRRVRWSEDGTLIEDYRLTPDEPRFAQLEQRRQWGIWSTIKDLDLGAREIITRPAGWGSEPSELPAAIPASALALDGG